MKYRVGDKLVVTGDKKKAQHRFPGGTLVEVVDLMEVNDPKDPWYGGVRCRWAEPEAPPTEELSRAWWIDQDDLAFPLVPVSDEELAEVYRSFGIDPTLITRDADDA